LNTIIKFGENVEGFNIPVLNEREIRAAAGILFLMMFSSAAEVVFNGDFSLLKYSVTVFLIDLLIRVYVNPMYSPSLIIGRLITGSQAPEYVGARQKKFAWTIGVALAVIMFISLVVMNTHSFITGIICVTCLAFLFFESAFGICLGCKFYPLFFKEKAEYCAGEVCDVKSKHDIQKTSMTQVAIVFALIALIFLTFILFNDNLSQKPYELFGDETTAQVEKIK
jgi:hypothetical protein